MKVIVFLVQKNGECVIQILKQALTFDLKF